MTQQPQGQSDTTHQEEQEETSKELDETITVSKNKNTKKAPEFEGNAAHKALKKKILDILKGEK